MQNQTPGPVPIGQFAMEIGESADAVRRAIQRGHLKGFSDGTRWYINFEEVAKVRREKAIRERRMQIARQLSAATLLNANGRAVSVDEFSKYVEETIDAQIIAEFGVEGEL